ncbi:flavin reductase [Rhodococcus qingshengii]|nr:flavin reductase [Rhodococcus qingshengii]
MQKDNLKEQWELLSTEVNSDDLRQAMRHQASGVTIVTNVLGDRPWGLTVSAFCSVTLDPPTVLVCLNTNTASAQATLKDQRFGVNLLSREQLQVAQVCSKLGTPKFIEDFCVSNAELPDTVQIPVLKESLVTFDCELIQSYEIGTHIVAVGRVVNLLMPPSRDPLIYSYGKFSEIIALNHERTFS